MQLLQLQNVKRDKRISEVTILSNMKKEEYVPRISSAFRQALDMVIKQYKEHRVKSSTLIKEAYRVATEIDKYSPKEAYALLRRELAEYCSPQWIRFNINTEAKEMSHSRGKAGKVSAQTVLEQSTGEELEPDSESKIQELEDEVNTLRAGLKIMTKRATDLEDVLEKTSFTTAKLLEIEEGGGGGGGSDNDGYAWDGAPGEIKLHLEAEYLEFLLVLLREADSVKHYQTDHDRIVYLENMFARLLDRSRRLKKKMLPST